MRLRLQFDAKQTTGRNTMFAFRGAYHGMTNGTMGMMGNLNAKARRTGLMSDVHFMPFPYSLRCPFGLGVMRVRKPVSATSNVC